MDKNFLKQMKYIKSQFQKFSGLQKIYTKATLIINLLKHVKGSLEKITALLSKNLDYNWQNNKLEIRGNETTCLRCWEWGHIWDFVPSENILEM